MLVDDVIDYERHEIRSTSAERTVGSLGVINRINEGGNR